MGKARRRQQEIFQKLRDYDVHKSKLKIWIFKKEVMNNCDSTDRRYRSDDGLRCGGTGFY